MCHPKEACHASIMAKKWIDLGLLTLQEMAMRAKQRLTSLPFPVFITELCRRAKIPWDPANDIKVIPSSSTDIRRIEAEFTREEVDWRRAAPADTSPERIVHLDYFALSFRGFRKLEEEEGVISKDLDLGLLDSSFLACNKT
ncbi:hypothetical protein MTR67_051776 [Solanum verrucosum]|uniref:Putative plant transposon protein domain-containing protein n=1 Tax=Solanum verrucosum TaxID=315347 RepID=A0AAF0V858_SOLVR|nr:hypothetical protein MTR67_051776 [Solanum verrucosum]